MMAANASNASRCVFLDERSGVALSDDYLKNSIKSTIGDNYTCLFIALAVLAVVAMVLYFVVSRVFGIFAEWHRLRKSGRRGAASAPKGKDDDDDAFRPAELADDEPAFAPQVRVAERRLKELEGTYAGYNSAMRRHAARRGVAPDDLVNGDMVDRRHDDYEYGSHGSERPERRGERRVVTGARQLSEDPSRVEREPGIVVSRTR
jgi:hypothetical protein